MPNRSQTLLAAALCVFLTACGSGAPATIPVSPVEQAPADPLPDQPPPPLPIDDVDFPEYVERTLDSGARLIVVQNAEQPVVSVRLMVPAGTAADPETKAGLAGMTASLLDQGTTSRSALEIAEAIDFIGASLSAGAASEWTSINLTTITEFLDEGLEVMSDVVLNPSFPADELETERQRQASALRLERSQPGALAQRAFLREVYGDHPYGVRPSAETVQAITEEDLEWFHGRHYRPEDALFVVAGDVDPAAVASALDAAFSDWAGAAARDAAAPAPPSRAGRDMLFVHVPGSVQAVIRIGHLFPSATDADWPALDVANQILGAGGFSSWMMKILREERGYTYGAGSQMAERVGPGYFMMTGEFRNEVADSSLAIMLDLMERLRAGDIPQEDLEAARLYLTGSFPRTIETPQQVANQVASNRLLGRPDSYLEEYRSRVADVDVEDVATVSRRYLDPQNVAMVVVGDAGEVLDRVRPFADEVRVIDAEGRPVDMERATAASDVRFDASALRPLTLTYGLRLQDDELGEVVTEWRRDRDDLVVITTQSVPLAVRQETRLEAATFRPLALRGTVGMLPDVDITVAEGRATGAGINMQTGQAEQVDVAVPEGAGVEGMLDVAIAVTDFDEIGEFTFRSLSAGGTFTAQTVRRAGEETITVPAGTFETWRLEIDGEQQQTVWVSREAPHIVVRRATHMPTGQTLEVVLKSVE